MSSKSISAKQKQLKEIKEKKKKLAELLEKQRKIDEGEELNFDDDGCSGISFLTNLKKQKLDIDFWCGYEAGGTRIDAKKLDELIVFLTKAKKRIQKEVK